LCRLATGGGMSIRTNYEDSDETLFQATRPIILNGINSVTSEPDLADRSITIQLSTISEENRKTEAEILERFNQVKPEIFGALCQAVSTALKNIKQTKLNRLPRMADFALWSTAAEPAYCQPGEFMRVYSGNRQAAIDESLSASPVMDAIITMTDVDGFSSWLGTPSALLKLLNENTDEKIQRSKSWPREPNHLIRKLNKSAPQLRTRGITFKQIRKKYRREIEIRKVSEVTVTTVTRDEKRSQLTDIVDKNRVTVKNNLPSPFDNLPSPDHFTVTHTSEKGDGNFTGVTVKTAGVTIDEKVTVTHNSYNNQIVTHNFSKGDDGDGKSASFIDSKNMRVFPESANDQKPKFRMVV
jgi:hypothetical protein